MRHLLALALLAGTAVAQSCANYGTALSNGTCACPPGFTGADCSSISCDNPLLDPSARQAFSSVLSSNASQGCTRQCSDGFTGPTCNVCTSDSACAAAVGTGANSSGFSSGLGQPVCSTSTWTWTQGFATCDVVNPTLQSVFSGTTTLIIQKTVEPTESLSSPFGSNGTVLAQLFYAPSSGNTTTVEQFYCAADSCIQSNVTSSGSTSVDWTCQNLQCTCIDGRDFCGGTAAPVDLKSTINGLTGTLEITCDSTGASCSFKQSLLVTLFGSSGLGLSGCKWGECVLPSTIDTLAAQLSGSSSGSGGGGSDLSGGVIAGLAVLGAVVVGLLALLALGYASQQRARKRARAKMEADLAASSAASSSSSSGGPGAGAALAGLGLDTSASTSSAHGAGVVEKEPKDDSASLPGIGLRWTNLSYSLPPPTRLSSFLPHTSSSLDGPDSDGKSLARDDGRLVLSSLSATLEGGSFCSILGPSGAGKSTLVDLLAGVRKTGYRGGSVELIGAGLGEGADGELEKDATAVAGKVRVRYVDQQDVLPETSTVKEAVMFAAELKLGEIPKETKRERVFEVLTQLGLLDIADSPIGSASGSGKRGISGGERRRVSIARELVASPAILILDEPVSGLDSTSALRILRALKSLTVPSPGRRPTTVLLTIHQPSSQLFHMFDDVVLLGQGGEQLFFGRKDEVGSWFESRGLACPEGWNPADFMLDIASSPSAPSRKHSLAVPSSPSVSPKFGFKRRRSSALPTILLRNENAHAAADRKPSTTLLTQFQVLLGRGVKELLRDPALVLMHNLVPLAVGLIVGGMFYKVDLSIGGFQSRVGSLFFLGCLVAFASLSALTHFSHAKALFVRERARGYFHSLAWLASTVVLDVLPLRILPTILLGVIVYFMVGLSATAAHFFKFLLILLLYAIATTLWNFFLAAAFTDVGVAILISSILNLFQLAYAGFFLNLGRIPPVLRWLQWLAPLKYALEALTINEVGAGLMIEDTLAGAKVQISAEIIMDTLFGFKSSAYYRDVLVLFGFICGFALLLVSAVLLKLRELR
ncbi:hypothetical protein JCM8097_008464 [Rhodosporidiobolus ruineniae]